MPRLSELTHLVIREKADATMKNRAIEIHDSQLASISIQAGEALLSFSKVYIHESAGRPGVDEGSGWVQEALLRIGDAAVKRSFSKFPADLLDGDITLGESVLKNEIPIPLSHNGTVELRLESWNDEVVLISGGRAQLELVGEPKYIEEFRP
jgi:hypothetical protein